MEIQLLGVGIFILYPYCQTLTALHGLFVAVRGSAVHSAATALRPSPSLPWSRFVHMHSLWVDLRIFILRFLGRPFTCWPNLNMAWQRFGLRSPRETRRRTSWLPTFRALSRRVKSCISKNYWRKWLQDLLDSIKSPKYHEGCYVGLYMIIHGYTMAHWAT